MTIPATGAISMSQIRNEHGSALGSTSFSVAAGLGSALASSNGTKDSFGVCCSASSNGTNFIS